MIKNEEAIERKLSRECDKYGIENIKGISKKTGYPDRLIFNHIIKEIHFIELKSGYGYKQQEDQKDWQDLITKCKGKYFLIDSEEKLEEYLKKYIRVEQRNYNGTSWTDTV